MFVFQLFQSIAEIATDSCRVVHQTVFFNKIDRGLGRDGGDWVAPKGRDLKTLEAGSDIGTGERSADWNAVAHAFRRGDDIGSDLPLLDAEPALASASPSGLHFIGDEESAVVLDDFEDDLEIFLGRCNEAADALNRLGDEGGDLSRGRGLDYVLNILGAGYFTTWISFSPWTAVTIRIDRVHDAMSSPGQRLAPCILSSKPLRKL